MGRTKAKRRRTRDDRYALTFGAEADAVRQGPCVAMRNFNGPGKHIRCRVGSRTIDDEVVLVWDPAHVVSVGAGGGRYDLVSLCNGHHRQQHEIGIESFSAMYGLDLRALADVQALAHEPPLGIRGLAARWNVRRSSGMGGQQVTDPGPKPLSGYEGAALLGWVRRRMDASRDRLYALAFDDVDGRMTHGECELMAADPVRLATSILDDLCWDYHEDFLSAHALCELAGWPS